MKKYIVAIMAAILVLSSCTDSQLLDDTTAVHPEELSSNEVNTLIEQARWGDGQAYLRLADCYRDGKGVKKDFIGMLTMVAQADEFGGISRMEDYLKTLPEGSDFKLIFDAVENCERKNTDEANSMFEQLKANGSADGYAIQGIMAVERGDTLEGIRLMEQGAVAGSTFAELLLCIPDWRGASNPDLEKLKALSDKVPFVNALLGKIYSDGGEERLQDESLAIQYYLKADQQACLPKRGARWLLYCYRQNKLQLSDRDYQRLQILAGETEEAEVENTSCIDETLEASVGQLLQSSMTEYDCKHGSVYVVETSTGCIKARVSLERKGKHFTPYYDSYNEESNEMLTAPTYLALLSSGRVSSNDIIDTGCGIYNDVKDHNWRRGGYGEITLEQALGYRSVVAFTKAKENEFGSNNGIIEQTIGTYLGNDTQTPLGILTFYNAIANGGRMVELVTEGDDVIVLNDQLAAPSHIEALQSGLRSAVTHGLFRKVGRPYTTVAACGRTLKIKGTARRMELCGYFPADNPMYTLMVILEKDGIPASAGGMCGPIMANAIDQIVDRYGLQFSLGHSAQDDIDDDNVVVVDTVAVE